MKKIFLLLFAMIASCSWCLAQTPDEVEIVTDDVQLEIITPAEPEQESEQEIKERERRLREHNDAVAFAKASNSMQRGYFVLVAENVQIGNLGYRHYDISPNSNFILVQDKDGIIQFALNNGDPGINGLGGWTGKGTVRNKHIKENKNGDIFMQYQLVSASVNASVNITLYNNSNRAVARVTGGVPITIYGEILPYRDSEHR